MKHERYKFERFNLEACKKIGLTWEDLPVLAYILDLEPNAKTQKRGYFADGKHFYTDDQPYFWVEYQSVIDALPLYNFKTTKTAKNNISAIINKLSSVGIVSKWLLRRGGTWTYFKVNKTMISILTKSESLTLSDAIDIVYNKDKSLQFKGAGARIMKRVNPKIRIVNPESGAIVPENGGYDPGIRGYRPGKWVDKDSICKILPVRFYHYIINVSRETDNFTPPDNDSIDNPLDNPLKSSVNQNDNPLESYVDNQPGNVVKKYAAPKTAQPTAPAQGDAPQDPGHDLQTLLTSVQYKKLSIISKLMHSEHIKIDAMWMDIISTHGLDILVAVIEQINPKGKTHISDAYITKTISSVQKIKAKEKRKEDLPQPQEGQTCTSTGQAVEVDIVPRVHCKVLDRDYVGKYHVYNYDYVCTCGEIVDPWKKQCPQCEAFFNWRWVYKDMQDENYDYANFSEIIKKNDELALKEAI